MNKEPVTVIVLGQAQDPTKCPIKLRFQYEIEEGMVPLTDPTPKFKYIELIGQRYRGSVYDIMYAYNDPKYRNEGVLYLGYWNDGFVG